MRIKLDPRKKQLVKTVSWIVLASFSVLYVLIHLLRGFSPKLVTGNTVLCEEKMYSVFDAYIMRNETVLYSEKDGYCDYLIDDGAYSKTEAELARVYNVKNAELESRIKEIDERIEILTYSACILNTVGIRDTRSNIGNYHHAIMRALGEGKLKDAVSRTPALLLDMYKLKHNTGGQSSALVEKSKEELSALISERASLIASLGEYESVVSSGVGNFFYGADGYESAYSCNGVREKTLSEFFEMFESDPISTQNAVGCYISDIVWYIALPTDMKTAVSYTAGKSYNVSFEYTSGHTFEMTLEKIVRDDTDKRAVMLFSCNKMPSDFDRTRFQKVRIESERYSGYRVPDKAIINRNGQTGVFILKDGKVAFRRIEVLYDNGLYSIVKAQAPLEENHDNSMISLNDTYIVSGKGLYEGKLID